MPPVPRQTPVGSSRRFAHLSLRLLLLLIGMFTAALGVALTTVADLGTTPISTVPYVFTVLTGYSFGTTTFFVNIFLVAGQVLLLRRRFSLWNLLQIPTVLIFGICIDLAMAIVSPHAPAGWWTGLLMSISGNFVLALGIVMQIRSKTIVQPGEGFVLAAAAVTRKSFGSIKIVNDVTLSLIAAGIGLVCAGELIGVREGTVLYKPARRLFKNLSRRSLMNQRLRPSRHPKRLTISSQTNDRPFKIANNKLLTNSRSYCLSALSKVIFTCFIKVSKDYRSHHCYRIY